MAKPKHNQFEEADRKLNQSTHDFLQRKANEALEKGDNEEHKKIKTCWILTKNTQIDNINAASVESVLFSLKN